MNSYKSKIEYKAVMYNEKNRDEILNLCPGRSLLSGMCLPVIFIKLKCAIANMNIDIFERESWYLRDPYNNFHSVVEVEDFLLLLYGKYLVKESDNKFSVIDSEEFEKNFTLKLED